MGRLRMAEKRRNPMTQGGGRLGVRRPDLSVSGDGSQKNFTTKVAWWWRSYLCGVCIKRVARNVSHG